jgi:hypothetical protein
MKPSEYFHRNVFLGASCMPRREAEMRHQIGVENIMWGSDYPHPEGTWPHTREQMRETFGGLPEGELRAMLGGNADAALRLRRPGARARRRPHRAAPRRLPALTPEGRHGTTPLREDPGPGGEGRRGESPSSCRAACARSASSTRPTPGIAAAVLPKPLEPAARPEVGVTFSHVAMQIRPDFTVRDRLDRLRGAAHGTRASRASTRSRCR